MWLTPLRNVVPGMKRLKLSGSQTDGAAADDLMI